MKKIILAFAFGFNQGHASIPENNLNIPIQIEKSKANTGEVFYSLIDQFTKIWKPVIKIKFNKNLSITSDWEDPSINASITRDMDNNPLIKISGGVLRHPQMNLDSFLLTLCHELGHYMGGAPKAFRGSSQLRSWSSVEGQADYFASSKCLPITFSKLSLKKSLDKSYKQEDLIESSNICSSDTCRRIVLAGLSVSKLYAEIGKNTPPELYNRSSKVVWDTTQKHPKAQCRLDTIIAGALCNIDPLINFDDADHSIGSCNIDPSHRPYCWFNQESY